MGQIKNKILWEGQHLTLVKQSGYTMGTFGMWQPGEVVVTTKGRGRTVKTLLVTSADAEVLSRTYVPKGAETGKLTKVRLARYIEVAEELDAQWLQKEQERCARLEEKRAAAQARIEAAEAVQQAQNKLLVAALGDSLDALIEARAAFRAAYRAAN